MVQELEEYLTINRELWFAKKDLKASEWNVWRLTVLLNEKEAEIKYFEQLKKRPDELFL